MHATAKLGGAGPVFCFFAVEYLQRGRPGMITSKQLAELAGVSRGTVDRVLNQRGGVSPEVRQRIERLAAQHGYRPNRAGKALVSREPKTIGVLLNSQGNPFFDDVKAGLRAALDDYSDFPVSMELRECRGYDLEGQLSLLRQMGSLSGLIITPLNHPLMAAELNGRIEAGCPVVTLNTDLEGCRRLAYVGCDYRRSGRAAGQMLGLLTQGKGRVLVVTGSIRVLGHNQRIRGFCEELKESFPALAVADIVENNDDDALSRARVAQALRGDPAIDALYFCAGGVSGGMAAVEEAFGSRRPTVITCDGTPEIRRLIEQGSVQASVSQQPFQQGYRAMKVLLDKQLFGVPPASDVLYVKNEIKIKHTI